MGIPSRKSVFGYSLRQFEYIGLAKEIKARAHHEDGLEGQRYRCLKLLREPKEDDWTLFASAGSRSDYLYKVGPEGPEADSEDDVEITENATVDSRTKVDAPVMRGLVEEDRLVSQWEPTRHLFNLIFDIVNAAGTEGVSTKVVSTPYKFPDSINAGLGA